MALAVALVVGAAGAALLLRLRGGLGAEAVAAAGEEEAAELAPRAWRRTSKKSHRMRRTNTLYPGLE